MKPKFYNITVNNDIVDVYSVSYSKNKWPIQNAKWPNWQDLNIVNNFFSFSPTELSTPRLVHTNRTPLTDLIKIEGFPTRGCVISNKFLSLLENFDLPPFRLYPIEIEFKKEIFQYYYILFIVDSSVDVDYSKTKFHVHKHGKTETEGLISYKEWSFAYENEEPYYVSTLSKNSEIFLKDITYDFFTLERIFSNSLIISENLKVEIEKKLFGIQFEECPNFKISK